MTAVSVTNPGRTPGSFTVAVEFTHTHSGETMPHTILGTAVVSRLWPGDTGSSPVSKTVVETVAGAPAPRIACAHRGLG